MKKHARKPPGGFRFFGGRGAGEAGEAFFPRGIFFKLDKHEQDVLNCKTSLLSGHQERIKRF